MNAFTTGWVMTLILFAALCGGSVYTYKILSDRHQEAAYDRCVERFGRTAQSAHDLHLKISLCQFEFGKQTAGRYSTAAGQPLRLAMVRRPDFSSY